MFNKIRTWLIFKLIGDQPVIMNIDVRLKQGVQVVSKTLLTKNSSFS